MPILILFKLPEKVLIVYLGPFGVAGEVGG